jgi:hypothetical protein
MMNNVTNEQLDAALKQTLAEKPETNLAKLNQTVAVANIVSWYCSRKMFYPPLDSKASAVFHRCCDEARNAGLL